MEIISSNIFQIDNELVKDAYNNLDNYEIILYEGEVVQYDLCVIYFSSNEIYYPNTAISFKRSIIQRNKYEWRNNLFANAHKHIFIRDIQKQWYLEGINSKVNSPQKLADLLKELTQGYKVITIGSSAGGFAAILFGSLLKVQKVYAFNAQLDLNIIQNGSNPHTDPILFKYFSDPERAPYFKVDNFVIPSVEYFYFQSSKSQMDIIQYNAFKSKYLINRLRFNTSNHGFPFLRHNLKYVLNLPSNTLKEMTKKEIHPFLLSVKVDGLLKTTFIVSDAILGRIKKKLKEKRESK